MNTGMLRTFTTFLAIIQPCQFGIKTDLPISTLTLTNLLLFLRLSYYWTHTLGWLRDVIVRISFEFLTKESIFHFQSSVHLWLRSSINIDRLTRRKSSVFWGHLTSQDAFQPLYEPTIDSLIVCEVHLAQVYLLAVLRRNIRRPYGVLSHLCSFWCLWIRFLMYRIQGNLRCSKVLRRIFVVHLVL